MAATGSTDARGTPAGGRGGGRWQRIAVLLEPGRSGVAAVERAVAIAREHESQLVLVAVAPQAACLRCPGPSAKGYNDAVCEVVAGDLAAASERIGRTGSPASSALLIDGHDPPLADWVQNARGGPRAAAGPAPAVGTASPSRRQAPAPAFLRAGAGRRPLIHSRVS